MYGPSLSPTTTFSFFPCLLNNVELESKALYMVYAELGISTHSRLLKRQVIISLHILTHTLSMACLLGTLLVCLVGGGMERFLVVPKNFVKRIPHHHNHH